MNIPLLDLNTQYQPIEKGIFATLKQVYKHKKFILGPEVKQLEEEVAGYSQCRHAVGVTSSQEFIL